VTEAIEAAQLTWAATGQADNISDVAAIISYVLGLRSKIVLGYRGAGDMSLAVMRNETDAGILSADSVLPYIQNKTVKPVALFALKRWHHLPDVPTLAEAASIPAEKAWLVDLRRQISEAQRAMVAAPGVPADRIDHLRAVFASILTDPAVIEEGVRTNREIDFLPGTTLQTHLDELMQMAGPRLAEFRKVADAYF
jgi:tripartite-type tricarboxylate transporter receptor subunit TctC